MLPGRRFLQTKSHKLALGVSVVLVLDQILKYFSYRSGIATVNSGVAFGFGHSWLPLIGLLVLLCLFFVHTPWRSTLVLVTVAALSNGFDRLYAMGVIDYIPLGPVQVNLADILILFLITLLILELYTKKEA